MTDMNSSNDTPLTQAQACLEALEVAYQAGKKVGILYERLRYCTDEALANDYSERIAVFRGDYLAVQVKAQALVDTLSKQGDEPKDKYANDQYLIKKMLDACDGLEDLEDCMREALQAVRNSKPVEIEGFRKLSLFNPTDEMAEKVAKVLYHENHWDDGKYVEWKDQDANIKNNYILQAKAAIQAMSDIIESKDNA